MLNVHGIKDEKMEKKRDSGYLLLVYIPLPGMVWSSEEEGKDMGGKKRTTSKLGKRSLLGMMPFALQFIYFSGFISLFLQAYWNMSVVSPKHQVLNHWGNIAGHSISRLNPIPTVDPTSGE